MDSFGKIVAILIAVVLLFLIPAQYMVFQKEQMCRAYLETETGYFVDSVRNMGYFSRNMYEMYCRKINMAADGWKIEMEHYKYHLDSVPEDEEKEITYTEHYYTIYQDDIIKELEDSREKQYHFRQGDYFKIKVYGAGQTSFFGNKNQIQLKAVYGGMIRDEAY